MSSSEFDLIRRYFTDQQSSRKDVSLGIGDDAALLWPPSGQLLVASVDTLISGVHFLKDTSPYSIAYKSLAVNLSDMAAMVAEPAWITLAITLPDTDDAWLTEFSRGLFALANEYNIQLVGGDTTHSPITGSLSITINITGFVPEGLALTRSGAVAGDSIYVTGTLGDAGAGLLYQQNKLKVSASAGKTLSNKLDRPKAQVSVGMALRELASASIDISDGLSSDLAHLLVASNVGADVAVDNLPLSDVFKSLKLKDGWQLAASAGDDYELCFTVAESHEKKMQQTLDSMGCAYTKIGTVSSQKGIRWLDESGNKLTLSIAGYDHFHTTQESGIDQ